MVQVPEDETRSGGKATDTETPIAFAVAPTLKGKIYALLPTKIETNLNFAIDARFDTSTDRSNLNEGKWNTWILGECLTLVKDTVVWLLKNEPAAAWPLIPPQPENLEVEGWQKNLKSLHSGFLKNVLDEGRVDVAGKELSLGDLCFLKIEVEGLLQDGDAELVCLGKTLIPEQYCDAAGAFRKILSLFDVPGVGIKEAFGLFDLPDTAGRPPEWCLELVNVALESEQTDLLTGYPCFVTSDGRTALSPKKDATDILTLSSYMTPLRRLNLVKQLHSRNGNSPHWLKIEEVIESSFNYSKFLRSEEYLKALAARKEPVALTDDELLEVRGLLGYDVDPVTREALGRVIIIDAITWMKGERVTRPKPAGLCYIPSSIINEKPKEKERSWAAAAEKIDGFFWAHYRYRDVIRSGRRRGIYDHITIEKGAKRFLFDIGCDVAPRLEKLPLRLKTNRDIEIVQNAPLVTSIKVDYRSPDIDLVLAYIAKRHKEKKGNGKSDAAGRSLALFWCLADSWVEYEAFAKATGEWEEKKKRTQQAELPATWVVRLRTEAWLRNERKRLVPSPGLTIGTSINRILYGNDQEVIAADLTENDAVPGLLAALDMKFTLKAPDLLSRLAEVKGQPDEAMLALALMQALAKRCESRTDTVDGIPSTTLRSRMEAGSLVYLPKHGWRKPSELRRTKKDEFGGRIIIVGSNKTMDNLWSVLWITGIGLDDCLKLIEDIGDQKMISHLDMLVLINVFNIVDKMLGDKEKRPAIQGLQRIAKLPLWVGDKFRRKRPIFMTDNPQLQAVLAEKIDVWVPPSKAMSIPRLLEHLNITPIKSENLSVTGVHDSSIATKAVTEKFHNVLDRWRNMILERNIKCDNVPWPLLQAAEIFVSDELSVTIDAAVIKDNVDVAQEKIPVAAHVVETESSVTFYFRDDSAIGSNSEGGRVLSSFFPIDRQDHVAMAWSIAWNDEKASAAINVAIDAMAEPDADVFSPLEDGIVQGDGKKSKIQHPSGKGQPGRKRPKGAPVTQTVEVVDLFIKDLNGVFSSAVTQHVGTDTGGKKDLNGRGLKDDVNKPKGNGSRSGGGKVIKRVTHYSDQDLETAGIEILTYLFNGHCDSKSKRELYDFRAERGIGADMTVHTNQVREWVELKSHAGAAPSTETLTCTELSRALREGNKFFLAVVSGLVDLNLSINVRLYRDPCKSLDWGLPRDAVFSGFAKAKHIECVVQITPEKS